MNIKDAKEQIKNAMRAYFTKDAFGNYVIPVERQRPVFLMGPPGIGKTAIMEQIVADLNAERMAEQKADPNTDPTVNPKVGLVSYSMTHHTRQSALGLPFIVKKNYGGKDYDVSEYTMSEIIASVYDMMEETGCKEGILFLDEINCVSETLAPAMLQFLQYKIFGRHTVPPGWIVVTAGNPPEYNNSVREFDIVTWDRLKRIDVEPDFDAWKEYALKKDVHASVTTYLEIHRDHFYKIETTVDGKSFVTARGWDDLSDMIRLYEANDIAVDEKLVGQYIQNRKIAKDFAVYYDLFNKYKSDYQVEKILNGTVDERVKQRAKRARFDEHLSLLGLILSALSEELRDVCSTYDALFGLIDPLNRLFASFRSPKNESSYPELLQETIDNIGKEISNGIRSSGLSANNVLVKRISQKTLSDIRASLKKSAVEDAAAEKWIRADYEKRAAAHSKDVAAAGKKLSNVFAFCEEVFGKDSQEILILITELSVSYFCGRFIFLFGCEEYAAHCKKMQFAERKYDIIAKYEALDLDD